MAAEDLFVSFVAKLTERERLKLGDAIKTRRADLFAARSEDARVRIVNDFLQEAHDLLQEVHR
jgi:hypothetical protein